jgi:hypothetical protein
MRTTSNSSPTTSRPAVTANPRKTRSVRPLGRVDVAELTEAVSAIPESVWDQENQSKPNKFDTLSTTRHIVFRFIRSFHDWRDSYDRPLWPEWKPLVEPVLAAATAPYGYERGAFPRVMLARMAPGGVIHPHHDAGPAAAWSHKIHVPLTTNEGVTFFQESNRHHFAVGEAVEVNNMDAHGVTNEGSTDRIHLIFEYFDMDQPEPAWAPPRAHA